MKHRMWSLLWIVIGFMVLPALAHWIPSPWNWLILIPCVACGLVGIRQADKADRTYGWPMPKEWEAEQQRRIDEYIKRSQS